MIYSNATINHDGETKVRTPQCINNVSKRVEAPAAAPSHIHLFFFGLIDFGFVTLAPKARSHMWINYRHLNCSSSLSSSPVSKDNPHISPFPLIPFVLINNY